MKTLRFHPIGDLFTSPTLSADFLSKEKYKRIAAEITKAYNEASELNSEIVRGIPSDARSRAYAVVSDNDEFCESYGVPVSIVELAAELTMQTLKRLAFLRVIRNAVYTDEAFAFKAPNTYADIIQGTANEHLDNLKGFSQIKDMIASRKTSVININQDILDQCSKTITSCTVMLELISLAKTSPSRSNQIAKAIKEASKQR